MQKIAFLTLLLTATLLFTLAFSAAAAGPKAPAAPWQRLQSHRRQSRRPNGIRTSMKLWNTCALPSTN